MTLTVKINFRAWIDRKPLSVEIPNSIPEHLRLGAAIKIAISKDRADLRSADLSGADLRSADLRSADLRSADLSGADLRSAVLSGAVLSGADLSGAVLSGAVLSGADLSGADLSGAVLSGAVGIVPQWITPLLMLLDQPGKIRAYKMVDADGMSPIHSRARLRYEIGKTVKVEDANTDALKHCAAGVNVATLDWILREWRPGYRVFIVEFTAADIAAIPTSTDGKFRLHRCKVVGEKTLDLIALGLEKPAK